MKIFEDDCTQFLSNAELSWQEMIQLSASPLLSKGVISQEYIDLVIRTCEEKGPYMYIGPKVVLAHSRPMPSTKRAAVSVLLTGNEIDFMTKEKKAQLWIFLASTDNKSHIAIIQKLAEVLTDSNNMKKIFSAKNKEELIKALQ